MWNVGLDEAQARVKIARRNVNNLRYGDDTTLLAESKEELKMRMKEKNEKTGLVSFIVQKLLCLIWSHLFIFVFICITLGGGSDLLQNGLVGSPCSPRDSQESLTTQFKSINSSALSFLYSPTLISIHVGRAIALTIQTLVCQVISLLFNMLSRIVIAFLPRSKCLLISWLQSPSEWFWSPRK